MDTLDEHKVQNRTLCPALSCERCLPMGVQPVHTEIMKGSSSKYQSSRDIPQFAPNFSIFVMAPDTVCLYSEDRKFFLHGEIFCRLAAAIAEGGKSFHEIFRALARDFPPDQIEEAIKRLVDRGHVVLASGSTPWAGRRILGEPWAGRRIG